MSALQSPLNGFNLRQYHHHQSIRILSGICMISALATCTVAGEPIVVKVWPGETPQDAGLNAEESSRIYQSPIVGPTKLITNVTTPTLTIYRPTTENTKTAMIICPGGGYWNLFWELEGEEVAEWLNSLGVTGIILKYRVPRRAGEARGEPAPGPLLDAQRAISLVRSRASDWDIDPGRIGMIGFSAGGHLSLATALNFSKRSYEPSDVIDEVSCRPDFAVLLYSGYLKAKDKNELWPGTTIPPNAPPVFLAHANDDTSKIGGSDPENSAVMYLGLKQAGVPVELHIFANGNHDFGVRPDRGLASQWKQLCVQWLRSIDMLPVAK
jgi:acetyl esterase/lipase